MSERQSVLSHKHIAVLMNDCGTPAYFPVPLAHYGVMNDCRTPACFPVSLAHYGLINVMALESRTVFLSHLHTVM